MLVTEKEEYDWIRKKVKEEIIKEIEKKNEIDSNIEKLIDEYTEKLFLRFDFSELKNKIKSFISQI